MRTVVVAALLFLLAACGGKEGETASAESAPKVSAATTCGQLFDGDAPLESVVDLMTAEASASDRPKAEALASKLDPIGDQANEDLAAHVGVVARELREYADTPLGEGFDTAEMVTSLTELNNACGVTPRF